MSGYDDDFDGLPADLQALIARRTRRPTGAEVAAAALSSLMEDWSPADRADALDALSLDLADGGSITVAWTDREDRR